MKALQLLSFCVLSSSLARAQCPTEPTCAGCRTRSRITCSSGGLTSFPNFPPDLQRDVEELTLRNNILTEVRAGDLVNYTSLEVLVLSFNNISYIEPGSFNHTTALARIDLTSNRITELPDRLFANTQLVELRASDNLIEELTVEMFTGLQVLPTIELNSNRITIIPNGTFSGIGLIDLLTLQENPLTCDCQLRWLRDFIDSPISPLTSNLGTCTVPSQNYTRTQFSMLTVDDFLCLCSPDCESGTCNTDVGVCECDDGYTGSTCDTECPRGSYGSECSQNCTCVTEYEASPCDHVNGTCYCLRGYEGSLCERECQDGFYGQGCAEVCQCQNDASCDFRTGSCDCAAGWMGQFCNISCANGTYGPNCSENCTCIPEHAVYPCDIMDGTCICLPSYAGSTCDVLICMDGYYGNDCQQKCTCVEKHQRRPCDRMTGRCFCLPDYSGQNCELLRDKNTPSPTTESDREPGSMPGGQAGVIVGAVVGSVLGISALIAIGVVVITAVLYFVVKIYKSGQPSRKINPSQQLTKCDNTSDRICQTGMNSEPPPSTSPPQNEHVQQSVTETKLIIDTGNASADVEIPEKTAL